jgi:hypothetical protein
MCLLACFEQAIRVHQNHADAVGYGVAGALVLEQCVLGVSIPEAIAAAKERMGPQAREAVDMAEVSVCLLAASAMCLVFVGRLHAAISHEG